MSPALSGSLSDNYIKVKSRKELELENDNAQLIVKKAGTNEAAPGGTKMPGTRIFETGVLMPQQFDVSEVFWGSPLSGTETHSWSPSAGIGRGHVAAPTEDSIPILTDERSYYPYPWFTGVLQRRRNNIASDMPFGHKNQSNTFDHVNVFIPGSTYKSGSGSIDKTQTDGSVGQDPESVERFVKDKLRHTRRGPVRR